MYFLKLDGEFNIIGFVLGEALDGCIEVTLEEYNTAQGYKYFNPETREFSEPIEHAKFEVEPSEHEKITKETYETTSMSAEDNLLNMDLLTSLDDKLNLIMEHLGLC